MAGKRLDSLRVQPHGKRDKTMRTYKLEVYSAKNGKQLQAQTFFDEDKLNIVIDYLDIAIENGAALEYQKFVLDWQNDWITI